MSTHQKNKKSLMHTFVSIGTGILLVACGGFSLLVHAAPLGVGTQPLELGSLFNSSANYLSVPPYLPQNVGDPNVIISLDTSGSMKAPAYGQAFTSIRDWHDGVVHDNYDHRYSYFGYFQSSGLYVYDTDKRFFVRDDSATTDVWNGNFLNWLTMRRIDIAREILVGGKVRDRAGETIDGQNWYVKTGQHEQEDREFFKQYSGSADVTPYPDGTTFMVAEGQIFPQENLTDSSQRIKTTVLQDGSGGTKPMELGQVSFDAGDNTPITIPFENDYIDPIVIVGPVTFNSGRSDTANGDSANNARDQNDDNPLIARTTRVGITGFDMRLQRWDYLVDAGIEHPAAEQVFYLVAEKGNYTLNLAGRSLKVAAGKRNTAENCCVLPEAVSFGAYLDTPVVLSSVGSSNDSSAVVTRNQAVSNTGFQVFLQEQESNNPVVAPHDSESVHWVAIESGTGVTTTTGTTVDIGSVGGINHRTRARDDRGERNYIRFRQVFDDNPIVVADMQTTNGRDPAALRVASRGYSSVATDMQWGRDAIGVFVEEEASSNPGNAHGRAEVVGYIAASGGGGYNIRVGILDADADGQEAPTGLLQQRAQEFRLGLAVANFQHADDPGDIYYVEGNETDGGTLYPCYPDVNLPISPESTSLTTPPKRTNSDSCKATHVKAPLGNLVDVIEDYPLTLGNSPVAETLFNITQYVSQTQHELGSYNSSPWPATANGRGNSPETSYQVSTDWDPYYYDELGGMVACAQTFVINVTDGLPNKDGDQPVSANDGTGSGIGNESLDDLALNLREHDVRSDLEGHQEIVTYYLMTALGLNESELDNDALRLLRESAANGGFVDDDESRTPDKPHPTDFGSYVQQPLTAGNCTVNEWDQNGDCSPDTFYFATDNAEVKSTFNAIGSRSFSGGSASSLAGSTSGAGAIYQATFEQQKEGDNDTFVNWTGDVSALFVDTAGRLRDDGGSDDELMPSDYTDDQILYMCFDGDAPSPVVRVHKTSDEGDIPGVDQLNACSSGDFNRTLDDINYIWSAGEWLAQPFTDLDDNRPYTSTNRGRHIISAIDGVGGSRDNRITSGEQITFVDSSFTSSIAGLIRERESADSSTGQALTEARKIVNWVRGIDDPALRSRALDRDGESLTWRLGDIINSSPIAVSAPKEDLDVIYSRTEYGASYREFRRKYLDRRTVVYAGGNDGMLHAFNGGSYDRINNRFNKGPSGKAQHDLGAELWAYVPYNLLPHLEYLATAGYGSNANDHLAMVDFESRVFDARIFNDPSASGLSGIDGQANVEHTGGWGTILVGAMRLGGGPMMVDADLANPNVLSVLGIPLLGDPNADFRLTRPAIFILDITDPEQPPQVLLEYSSNEISDLLNLDGNGDVSVLGTRLSVPLNLGLNLTSILDAVSGIALKPLNFLNLFEGGHTLSVPAPIISGYDYEPSDPDSQGTPYLENWHLALGTGARDLLAPSRAVSEVVSTNPARITLLDLKTMRPDPEFGGTTALIEPDLDLIVNGDSNPGVEELDLNLSLNRASFVTGMLSVDYDLDVNSDAMYFTTLSGNDNLIDILLDPLAAHGGEAFSGSLNRLTLRNADSNGINTGAYRPVSAWTTDTMLSLPNQPITAMPNVTVDETGNRWVLFGTGRYYTREDGVNNDTQAYYGVKEPRGASGFTWSPIVSGNLADVTDVIVKSDGAVENAPVSVGGSSTDTFTLLVDSIVSDSSIHGWYRNFPANSRARNIGQASILGGTATFTTFQPPRDVCRFQGESTLYAVDYRTGTATPVNILNTPPGTDGNPVTLKDTLSLGKGLVSTINQHTGKGHDGNNKKSRAGALGSSGALQLLDQDNTSAVIGGEVDWRAL